jgi:oligoribonuclease
MVKSNWRASARAVGTLSAMATELPHLIWIDCEMTGLDLATDALVEIAVLVTDSELNVIGEGVDVVIHATQGQLDAMNDFVKSMHTASGLITQIPSGISVSAAEEKILEYLQASGTEPGKSPLAGNSVSVDRNFIARDMPKLNEYLHYRTIDVSSIKELARRWHPKTYFASPAKTGNHRALGDIQDSIAELAYYRTALFVNPANNSTPEEVSG